MLHGKLTGTIQSRAPELRVASWSYDPSDAESLAHHLVRLGAFTPGSISEYRLLTEAPVRYDEMVGERTTASQAFVAMRFDDSMEEPYEIGFKKAIVGSGYEPIRIDLKQHDRKIDDQIIAEIRRSAFVVADFTGHRGGVYYEAGFAHGLGRSVIFTCKKDDFALHFDVRQYNTIAWENAGDILVPLQNRILALFGAGSNKPNARPLTP